MSASIATNKSLNSKASSRIKKKKRSNKTSNVSSSSSLISSSTTKTKQINQREVDFDHRTNLYCHIVKRDWDAASKRCRVSPEEASTWIVTKGMKGSNLRFLPLHKACVLQPPASLLDSLISAYPDGVWCEDHDGWLPIHCAAYTGANQDLIETLLLANPAGSRAKDQKGLLPMHYACMKGAGRSAIAPLLQYYPESIFCADDNKRWPAHYAITKGHVDCLDTVLSISGSDALSMKEEESGMNLLHYACVEDADDEIIHMLINYYPEALKQVDKESNLPIHHVCQYKVDSLDLIEAMLHRHPESVNIHNQMGHTPLECAQTILNHPMKHPTINLIKKFEHEHHFIKQNESVTVEEDVIEVPKDKKLPVSFTVDVIQRQSSTTNPAEKNNEVETSDNQIQLSSTKNDNSLYFCSNNREIKNQVEGLNQTVETLSVIFQEIATLREEIQTTLVKAKDNRIAFQSLSEQLLDIESLQHPHNNNQFRESSIVDSYDESEESSSSTPVDDHDCSSSDDESVSDASSASIQKLEGVKDASSNNAFVDNSMSSTAKKGEMREDLADASRDNVIIERE